MPWTTNKFINLPDLGSSGATAMNLFHSGLQLVDTRLAHKVYVGDPYYGATPDNTGTSDAYAYFADLLAAIGSDGATLVIPRGTYKINSTLTIPSNITLCFLPGAKLSITAGVTIPISGHIQDTMHQIFVDNAIAADITKGIKFARGSVEYVRPEWFGAVGDNGTGASQIAANVAAFNACGVCWERTSTYYSRGTVKLATGSYCFGDVAIIPRGGVKYQGQGHPNDAYTGTRLVKLTSGAITNLFTDTTEANFYKDAWFDGIRFQGMGGNSGAVHALSLSNLTGTKITNCVFDGFQGQHGDYAINSSVQLWISGCQIKNCSNGIVATTDSKILWNDVSPTYEHGIYVSGAGHCNIQCNKVYSDGATSNITKGITLIRGSSPTIIGNILDHNDYGLYCSSTGSGGIGGTIANNEISNQRIDGVVFNSVVSNMAFRGNKVYSNAGYGIRYISGVYQNGGVTESNEIYGNTTGQVIMEGYVTLSAGYSLTRFSQNLIRYGTTEENYGNWMIGLVGEAVAVRDTVYRKSDGKWYKADADDKDDGKYPCRGIVVVLQGTANRYALIMTSGRWRYDSWTWTPGADIHLASGSGLVEAAPSTTDNVVQKVAWAENATSLVVNPSTYTEIVP